MNCVHNNNKKVLLQEKLLIVPLRFFQGEEAKCIYLYTCVRSFVETRIRAENLFCISEIKFQ